MPSLISSLGILSIEHMKDMCSTELEKINIIANLDGQAQKVSINP